MTRHKRIQRLLFAASVLLSAAGLCSGLSPGWTETWSTDGNVEGWVATNTTYLAILHEDASDYLQIRFAAQGVPQFEDGIACADTNASAGNFVGCYSQVVTHVTFDFVAETVLPSTFRVYFYSAFSGYTWHADLGAPDTTGVWTNYSVPFDFGEVEWTHGPMSTEEEFLDDLQNVEWIGLYLSRNGTLEQNYGVDNFALEQRVVQFEVATASDYESETSTNIVVVLEPDHTATATVDYVISGGTAESNGVDYALSEGTLTFLPGVTNQAIAVTINNETMDEWDETIELTLFNPTKALLGANGVHTYTILNDDTPPSVEFALAASSGAESVTPAELEVLLSAESGKEITIDYAATGGTAQSNSVDYAREDAILTFQPGETNLTIAVDVQDDSLDEWDETVELTLSNPINASLGGNTIHTYTITDDDAEAVASLDLMDSPLEETNDVASVTIYITPESGKTVDVFLAVSGTATVVDDYTLTTTNLTFLPGVTNASIVLTSVDDSRDEDNETVVFDIDSTVDGGTGTPNQVIAQIIDDDPEPQVSFALTASNGDESTSPAYLEVVLSGISEKSVSVDYTVTGGSATGSGTDYSLGAGTLNFAPTETNKSISVTVMNDSLDEWDETIEVTLSLPSNCTLGGNTIHTYTILDVNPEPNVFLGVESTPLAENGGVATVTAYLDAES
ncbi:MAG: hypothetical protein JXR37_26235, partial [Kiritimatiellae bacterium]|nr:hypothetical protein [Kiritimatiellia bacterium]